MKSSIHTMRAAHVDLVFIYTVFPSIFHKSVTHKSACLKTYGFQNVFCPETRKKCTNITLRVWVGAHYIYFVYFWEYTREEVGDVGKGKERKFSGRVHLLRGQKIVAA